MLFHIYNPYDNKTVSEYYINTIIEALRRTGNETLFIDSLKKGETNKGILTVAVEDAIKAKKYGYKRIMLWVQGILPEESFLRRGSTLRYSVLSMIEKRGLACADFCIFVSDAMRVHFYDKYSFTPKYAYIMPCFNDEIQMSCFMVDGKYSNNTFVYAGGMQKWQCFEETAHIYSLVEKEIDNCHFRVLTKDSDQADKYIKKYNIKRYSIGFVEQNKIGDELKSAKFGFSLRKDNPVNKVATPTKLSTYVAYGVMPIYTGALGDFSRIAIDNPFCLRVNLNSIEDSAHSLVELCNKSIDAQSVYTSFRALFGKYYSRDYHISRLSDMIVQYLRG